MCVCQVCVCVCVCVFLKVSECVEFMYIQTAMAYMALYSSSVFLNNLLPFLLSKNLFPSLHLLGPIVYVYTDCNGLHGSVQ